MSKKREKYSMVVWIIPERRMSIGIAQSSSQIIPTDNLVARHN